jgi:hypothetical protein
MYPTSSKYNIEFGALPVATRCWADYYPEVDTSNSFACTASDTCRVSNLDYGETLNSYGFLVEDGNQIVCDACPLQPGGLINQFGCDTYTKQCTCNRSVPPCVSRAINMCSIRSVLHITLALSVFPCVMHVHVQNLIKHDLSDNIGPSACVRNVSTHSETPRTLFPAKITFGGKNSRQLKKQRFFGPASAKCPARQFSLNNPSVSLPCTVLSLLSGCTAVVVPTLLPCPSLQPQSKIYDNILRAQISNPKSCT